MAGMTKFLLTLPVEDLAKMREWSSLNGVSVSQSFRIAATGLMTSGQIPCGIVMSGLIASGYALVVRSER